MGAARAPSTGQPRWRGKWFPAVGLIMRETGLENRTSERSSLDARGSHTVAAHETMHVWSPSSRFVICTEYYLCLEVQTSASVSAAPDVQKRSVAADSGRPKLASSMVCSAQPSRPAQLYLISQLIGTIHHLNLDLHVVNDITEGKGETSERLLWPEPDVSAGVKPRNSVY